MDLELLGHHANHALVNSFGLLFGQVRADASGGQIHWVPLGGLSGRTPPNMGGAGTSEAGARPAASPDRQQHNPQGRQHGGRRLAEKGAAMFLRHAGLGDDRPRAAPAAPTEAYVASAGSKVSPISRAASPRSSKKAALNAGSTDAFFSSTSIR